MRVKNANGTILETNNPEVINIWLKAGYKALEEAKPEPEKPKRSRKKAVEE